MSVVEEPKEQGIPVYDPDEAIVRARPLPARDALVVWDVPDDEWAAFQSVLAEV